jgi:hypothetical protein
MICVVLCPDISLALTESLHFHISSLPVSMIPELLIVAISLLPLLVPCSAHSPDVITPLVYEQQEYYRICPLPKCASCPTAQQLRAPGIGFALETSHGYQRIPFVYPRNELTKKVKRCCGEAPRWHISSHRSD